PPESKRRRKNLACRAHVHDAVWGQALQRPNWFPVVAILSVVIVLDDNRTSLPGPFEQRPPSLGSEDGAGRVLVRRRCEHGLGLSANQVIDSNSALVDWNARCFQPGGLDVRAHVGMTRILDGEPPHAALAEHAADKANPLRRAGGEDDVLRLRD